jgi:AraC family transcriptional regulator
MTEQFAISQSASIKAHEGASAIPLLFRSSEESNWEGLVVRAFHEPGELEGWIDPAVPDTSLVLVTQGAMYMEQRLLNGPWRGQHIRQGDLFLKPGGSGPYELRWRSLSPEPLQTLHLHLNTYLLARTAEEVADRDPARLALIGHSGFQDPLLTQIGLALWRELEQDTPAGKLYAQTAAQMLAVHLLRHYTSTAREIEEVSQGLTRHQVKRVTDFMRAHLSQDLSLDVLAQQIGFSPYHFARLFRQTLGESPHQFVLRQRIARAQHLLKEVDVPLAHIALACGFANQSHLSLVFKRHLGLTPRAYRQDRQV